MPRCARHVNARSRSAVHCGQLTRCRAHRRTAGRAPGRPRRWCRSRHYVRAMLRRRLWHRAAGGSTGSRCGAVFLAGPAQDAGDSSHTMTRRICPRGWLILVLCAAAGIAVTVTVPGSGAGAARVTAACDTASHGVRTGWQHTHDPKRSHPKWLLLCTPTSPVPSTGESAPRPAPSLTRIPADQTTLTLPAGQPGPPRPAPSTRTGPPSEQRHEVEVAANSLTAAGDSLVLIGLVLTFILAVSGLVLAAGRRRGRRAD